MLGKQHTGPRRDSSLEAKLCGDAKLAWPGGRPVADRIAEMRRLLAERRVDHGGALLYLAPHLRVARLLQHHMVDRVRTNRRKRIGGDLADLVPGHAQVFAERRTIDAVAGAEIAHGGAQLVLAI